MSITLLTAVPGGGKTSYVVWNVIKKAHEENKVIYTCGIPKLKIPTIELSYKELQAWHERDEQGELPKLQNIEHNSIIVVDEVQKLWPATGSKITQDIKDLSEHRHFGLTFCIITQSPTLIHRNVLALVDRHLHIRPNWSGRKLYEWPEYCRNPSAAANKNVAVVTGYTLPKQSFNLYHSATEHIKPVKRIPIGFYIFALVLIATPVLGYQAFDRITSKGTPTVEEETYLSDQEQEQHKTEQTVTNSQPQQTSQNIHSYQDIQLVSRSIDWLKVSSCVANKTQCICYGQSAERLVIPLSSCELAVKHGWPGKPIAPRPIADTIETSESIYSMNYYEYCLQRDIKPYFYTCIGIHLGTVATNNIKGSELYEPAQTKTIYQLFFTRDRKFICYRMYKSLNQYGYDAHWLERLNTREEVFKFFGKEPLALALYETCYQRKNERFYVGDLINKHEVDYDCY